MSIEGLQATPNIEDLLAFNQQLEMLVAAGLRVELGDGVSSESVAEQLSRINSRIALEVGRGQSVEGAMAADTLVPGPYRAAWETWFHGNKPIEALNALTSQAEARREMQVNVGSSLIQPLIVLSLVYFGFIYLVLFASRQLEITYEQIGEPASASLKFLVAARDWLPVWGILIPLLLILAIVLWLMKSSGWNYEWLPGRKRFVDAISKANYAENVARLLETNHSLDQSRQLLGPFDSRNELPAMLRWAFAAQIDGETEIPARASLLRFTAHAYRDAANREIIRWRNWLPVLVGVVVGGVIVLAYGLSLFMPMIELLKMLTKP